MTPPTLITIDGEEKRLYEWVKEYGPLNGITKQVVIDRMKRGMDAEEAITKPVRKYNRLGGRKLSGTDSTISQQPQ